MDHLVSGLGVGLSLIVAIGAQNAFVLRQGIRGEWVGRVVALCAASDAVLIVAGVAGLGFVVRRAPWLIDGLRWLGVAFLIAYGLRSLWRARHPESLAPDQSISATARRAGAGGVLLTAAALTWLNPHVYLDTVLMLGSIANQHGHPGRWWFAAGAALASVLWFSALGFGARLLTPVLARPSAWRLLDVTIALVMFTVAYSLASTPPLPH